MISDLLSLRAAKVLVVGDVMVDRYVTGQVNRISPEAPVPVISHESTWSVPGGAANVAMNIAALGSSVGLVCALGDDQASDFLRAELMSRGVSIHTTSARRPVPVKTRIRTDLQQIVRIDEEDSSPLGLDQEVLDLAVELMTGEGYGVLLLSDYSKGLVSSDLTRMLVAAGRRHGFLTIADPKKSDPDTYKDIFLLKPNLTEAQDIAGVRTTINDGHDLSTLARLVRNSTGADNVVVTGGPIGCSLATDVGSVHFPAPSGLHVRDVSGAGDTFVSFAAAGVGSGLPLESVCRLATLASSISCTYVGTSPVRTEDILRDMFETATDSSIKLVADRDVEAISALLPRPLVFTNGCFDVLHPGHVASLEFARSQGASLVVAVNSDESVRLLKGENRPLQAFDVRARVLCALSSTSMVCCLFDETPLSLIERIAPDVLVKGADYRDKEVVGQTFVESRGGRVVLSPILPGHSTTDFEKSMARSG